jgi:hypothetical protein
VQADHEIQKIHRVDVDLIAQVPSRINALQIHLGRNVAQRFAHDLFDLTLSHTVSLFLMAYLFSQALG